MKLLICLILIVSTFSACQKNQMVVQTKSFWKPYSQQALFDSLLKKKPVIIDFYAEWCPVCHDLDRTLFANPQIQAKLATVTALRMDVTDQDDPEIQKIVQQYGIDGLPTIVFLDSKGHEIDNSRIIGFVTPNEFSQVFALLK